MSGNTNDIIWLMYTQSRQSLIAIVGPTGVGKTAFAITVAKKIKAELISVDSRQIYIGMDIATGKEAELGSWINVNGRKVLDIDGSLIHGLDLVRPDEQFSVYDWYELAIQLIGEIEQRGNVPLLVGGTGFYLNASFEAFLVNLACFATISISSDFVTENSPP